MDILTGRLHEEVVDWSSGGSSPLELKRTYTSTAMTLDASPYSSLGYGWRTNFDARLRMNSSTASLADWANVILPDSFEYNFNKQNGVWQPMAMEWSGTYWPNLSLRATRRTDLDVALTVEGEQFVLRTPSGISYVFDTADHVPDAAWHMDGYRTQVLAEIRYPGGYVQKIDYNGDFMSRVSDNLGRWLEMRFSRVSWRSTQLTQVLASDGSLIGFNYQDRLPGLTPQSPIEYQALASVTYPAGDPASTSDDHRVSYEYLDGNGAPGLLLGSVTDERGIRFSTWTYDSKGRVLSSQHAGGQDRWQFAYDDANGAVTVTNPLGRATKYTYRQVAGFVRQLTAVAGIATSNCAASNTQYGYDANGSRNRAVDAEGRVTQWTRDAQGRPLSVTEAAGTSSSRTTTMTWMADRPLLLSTGTPSLNTVFMYDGAGKLTSSTSRETAAPGRTRVTTYQYAPLDLPVPPAPGPTSAPLADVPLTLFNPAADQGTAGWTNMLGPLGNMAAANGQPCPSSNPCFSSNGQTQVLSYQPVVVPAAYVPQVDAGLRAARIAWRQNVQQCCGGYGAVALLFIGANGQPVGSLVPSVEAPDTWTAREKTAPIPAGTRFIQVAIIMARFPSGDNNSLVDDIDLRLVADGSAAPNPFLSVANPSGLAGVAGWATVAGQGGVKVSSLLAGCPFCTYFSNVDTGSGNSSVSQIVRIPADRTSEIDAGTRGLEVSWLALVDQQLGSVIAGVEFLDGGGQVLAGGGSFWSTVSTGRVIPQTFRLGLVPAGTRQLRLTMSTAFPAARAGNVNGSWAGVTARLVPTRRPPASRAELLTAVDGPLPGAGDTMRYGYDGLGNLTSVTNELGQVTRVTRLDAGGRPLSVTDPNGVVTSLAYDQRGRLTSVTVNPGAAQARTVIAYDPAGQVTQVTSPDGSSLQYSWSDARRLVAITNNGGERIDYGYNANGDMTSRTVKSAGGGIVRQQSAVFDELGRLLQSIGAAGQQTLFRYDRTDNLTSVQDPQRGLFSYAYDALQNLVALTNETGARTQLTRNAQGQVTGFRDPRGLTTTYLRNGFGDIVQETGPDVGTTLILRDERGLATRITDPRGVVTNLTYDAAGRLVAEAYPANAAENVTYQYDAAAGGNKGIGRLTGLVDGSGSTAFVYDALGRIVSTQQVIAGKSYVTAFGYNAGGRLTAITYPSGRVVSYTRNALGRITAVATRPTASGASVTVASGLAWSPMSNRLLGLTHGNGLTASRSYDGDGRITALKLANGTTRLMDLSYAYGDGMNLTAVNDNLSAANSISLAYDAAQRLISGRGPWGSLTYGYTPNGDRAQEVLTPPGGSALTTTFTYPVNANRLASTSRGAVTTRSFTYDPAGNLVAQVMGPLRLAFTYNQRNRPVTLSRTGDGTQVSSYLYNALEQLVQRSTTAPGGPAGTVHYIYGLDGALLAEADAATGRTVREYVWLPQGDASPAADNDNEEDAADAPPLPLALVTGVNTPTPGLLMVHADHLSRPLRLTDATRTTVWSASYDPFGQLVSLSGPVDQNLRFPGQYFLIESGLAYNWNRLYDAATGRYTQPDPLRFVDGPSVYGYAGQSPLMRVDPKGLQFTPISPGLCLQNPMACVILCVISPALCGVKPQPDEPPICMGPSEDHAKKECENAADGSDEDWENFCLASRWFGRVDKTRSERCRRYALSSNTEKKNFCYNEFGD